MPDRAIRIDIASVSGDIASVVVHSAVYVEYALLARTERRLADHHHAVAVGGWPRPARLSDVGGRDDSTPREQTRARYPDTTGFVERDGVRVFYEVYGSGRADRSCSCRPGRSSIRASGRLQIPYLARRYRVITFDGRGNGRSDRPADPAAYARGGVRRGRARGAWTRPERSRAVLVGLSMGASGPLLLAATIIPERVAGVVFIAPAVPLGATTPRQARPATFREPLDTDEGWGKYNRHYWRRDYRVPRVLLRQVPHRAALDEADRGHGRLGARDGPRDADRAPSWRRGSDDRDATFGRCARVRLSGPRDPRQRRSRSRPCATGGARLARAGGRLIDVLEGARPHPECPRPGQGQPRCSATSSESRGRMLRRSTAPRTWTRALARRRRALYISSPIGLGHAQRDVAIADELRKLHPDLEIDWLAQHPVTAVLEAHGERIHPLSAELASESAHITAESSEHDLNAFQAIRRMDEILVANFMVFHDAVEDGEYDLVIGDEAWDVDHYLHENPELKRTAFAWMTDFVGWLPMPAGGEREAFLTADYNAEMIEHVERFPRIRDRAIFVGEPDDIVPDDFGPGLPSIRDWTERHYAFSGYVTGFDPTPLIERREELRRELGFRPDERVVIVTRRRLRRRRGAAAAGHRELPGGRAPGQRPADDRRRRAADRPGGRWTRRAGVEVRAFVPDLYRHLAACDLAVVQGGLTTTMELAAARRPFLYFPLRNHFEQNRHVRHRLERYGAGRCMDYDASPPEVIAEAIADEIDRPVDYRPGRDRTARRARRRSSRR